MAATDLGISEEDVLVSVQRTAQSVQVRGTSVGKIREKLQGTRFELQKTVSSIKYIVSSEGKKEKKRNTREKKGDR